MKSIVVTGIQWYEIAGGPNAWPHIRHEHDPVYCEAVGDPCPDVKVTKDVIYPTTFYQPEIGMPGVYEIGMSRNVAEVLGFPLKLVDKCQLDQLSNELDKLDKRNESLRGAVENLKEKNGQLAAKNYIIGSELNIARGRHERMIARIQSASFWKRLSYLFTGRL